MLFVGIAPVDALFPELSVNRYYHLQQMACSLSTFVNGSLT